MASGDLFVDNPIANTNDHPLEIFCIILLDVNVNDKENKEIEHQLRSTINHFRKFNDAVQCGKFIRQRSKHERVILIVCGGLEKEIIPSIHNLRVIVSIYVYCMDVQGDNIWVAEFSKVRYY